ncbi:MAG: LysM peptidoglycan-binding domain-containing protein [Oscillospiraceae bacterium]
MKFEFWIKEQKGTKRLLFPVTPKGYEVTYGNEIETVRATSVGDINIVGHKRPYRIKIEGFFTVNDYTFVNSESMSANTPMDYVKLFKKWVDNKSILRLTIADEETTKINELFYVEDISCSESHETNGDIDYVISLREYKQLKSTKSVSSQSKSRMVENVPQSPKTYTVKYGDCLWNLSRKFYGDPTKYTKIHQANIDVIGKNPNILYVGQVLKIP